MKRLLATLALAASAAVPPARGDDFYEPPPAEEQPQVDVSVDMGAPGASVTFDTFQQGLSPYGQWLNVGAYGPVWRPNVAAGWRPYHYGHWVWTHEGWLWVSDEPWGWGPYHYGRWFFDASYGWLWVPGYQWAPAWVSWRYSADVVGWSPLGPGLSIYSTGYPAFYASWTFVPCASFVGVPVHTIAYAPSYYPSFYGRTLPAPPRAMAYGRTAPAWGGPAHGFVEQRVGRTIPATPIAAVASPAQVRPGRGAGPVPVFRPPAPTAAGAPRPQPGWGSPARPGWGPPGRVPAPGAQPGSRPSDNRPGWGTPPSRGPAPVAPGPRQAPGPSDNRPGWGAPPSRGPAPVAPGAQPGSRPSDNRPGWGAPPSRGPAPVAPGPRQAPGPSPSPGRGGGYAPPAQRGWSPPPAGGQGRAPAFAPQGGRAQAPSAAPRGGYAPVQRGGGRAAAPVQRGGQSPSRGHADRR